jgi:hypothetical protein
MKTINKIGCESRKIWRIRGLVVAFSKVMGSARRSCRRVAFRRFAHVPRAFAHAVLLISTVSRPMTLQLAVIDDLAVFTVT